MSGFVLSPGITPELTDLFVVEFPLLLGIGYLWKGGRGVALAFGLNAAALAVSKLVTDFFDLYDALVAGSALLAGLGTVWLTAREGPIRSPTLRGLGAAIAVAAVVLCGIKIRTDFFDPFDLLLADAGLVSGLVVLASLFRASRRQPSKPHSPAEDSSTARAREPA